MPKAESVFNLGEPFQELGTESRGGVFQSQSHDQDHCRLAPCCRRAIAKTARGVSFLINANDGAIDELFDVIEKWERTEGRPFFTNQHLHTEQGPEPVAELTVARKLDKDAGELENTSLAERAQAIIKERQLQYRDMPLDLKSDKFVRILLVLLVEALLGRDVRLTSIGYAIDRPQTSVIRYLQQLEEHGLISRGALASDGRVTLIELTEQGDKLAKKLVCHAMEAPSPSVKGTG